MGFQILGKCEFLNPGGSVKDRVAVKIIEEVIYTFSIIFLHVRVYGLKNLDLEIKEIRIIIMD